MYVYNRQCHKAVKQAAVFPIEVQLTIRSATPAEEEEEGEGEGERETRERVKVQEPQEDLLIQTD